MQCMSAMFFIRKHLEEAYQQLFNNQWQTSFKHAKTGWNIPKLNNFQKQQVFPFVIYADLEAIAKKVRGCKPNYDKSYTETYQTDEDCC